MQLYGVRCKFARFGLVQTAQEEMAMKKSLPLIGLFFVTIVSYLFLDDFFIQGGLNSRDVALIPAVALGGYTLGLICSPNFFENWQRKKD